VSILSAGFIFNLAGIIWWFCFAYIFLHSLIIIRLLTKNGYCKLYFFRHAFSPFSLLLVYDDRFSGRCRCTGKDLRRQPKIGNDSPLIKTPLIQFQERMIIADEQWRGGVP